MARNVDKGNTAVRLRLSAAQIKVLAPGISLLVSSHEVRQKSGTSPFSYPFRIFPPHRAFDRGTFNQSCMDKTLSLQEIVKTHSKNGRWARLDTIDLRAAIFAIRAYIDFVRFQRRQHRRKAREFRGSVPIDDRSLALLKAKSRRMILSLERHMKRANRASMKAIGKKGHDALVDSWKAHLRWMRLRIAYFKPLGQPVHGLRKRQQKDLDDLMQMAKRGLRNARYHQPSDKDLRRVMRLYARSSRQGRQGKLTVHSLVENKQRFDNTYHLAHFVIDHLKLKELSKS